MPRPLLPQTAWIATADHPPLEVHSPRVRALIESVSTPLRVQRWLNAMPYNWERRGETLRTLGQVVRRGQAHCLEAALAAATILEYHGYPPILMDLESQDQLDHVLFLYRRNGRFGTIARSRDPGLHGRRAVFPNLYSLVRSYAAPYIDLSGRIVGYGVLDLRTLKRDAWRTSKSNVWYVEQALIDNRHRRFRVSDAYYHRWHRRYVAYKKLHPHDRPTFYHNRHLWTGP